MLPINNRIGRPMSGRRAPGTPTPCRRCCAWNTVSIGSGHAMDSGAVLGYSIVIEGGPFWAWVGALPVDCPRFSLSSSVHPCLNHAPLSIRSPRERSWPTTVTATNSTPTIPAASATSRSAAAASNACSAKVEGFASAWRSIPAPIPTLSAPTASRSACLDPLPGSQLHVPLAADTMITTSVTNLPTSPDHTFCHAVSPRPGTSAVPRPSGFRS